MKAAPQLFSPYFQCFQWAKPCTLRLPVALCACMLSLSSQSSIYVQGVVQHMCTEPSGGCWVLTGSSRGQMALWDMRFQLQVCHRLAK